MKAMNKTKFDLAFPGNEVGGGDELDGVSKRCLHADAGEDGHGVVRHLNVLLLTPAHRALG